MMSCAGKAWVRRGLLGGAQGRLEGSLPRGMSTPVCLQVAMLSLPPQGLSEVSEVLEGCY